MSKSIHARESDARLVLRVRAVEETDPDGHRLSPRQLRQARDEARQAVGEAADPRAGWHYLVARARILAANLTDDAAVLPGGRVRRWLPPLILGIALALGLATAVLGPERRINLLSLPLFGILLWNLGLYLVLILGTVFHRRSSTEGFLAWFGRWSGGAGTGARRRFAELWAPVVAPLEFARTRRLFHLAALALALGVLAGMYLRGLAFAYQVTWESTFLSAGQVQALMEVVLGPAAALLGTAVRPVAGLEAPAAEAAGPWIHLFALTLLLVVGLPRLLLVTWESLRILRLGRALPVDLSAAYFRRRLAEGRGETRRIAVCPYSFEPGEAARNALSNLLLEHFGSRAEIRWQSPLEYGQALDRHEGWPLLLFSLAQTPEAEVHGELLQTLAQELEPEERWAVVDEGGFAGGEERRQPRRRLWRRGCLEAGFAALVVDLATLPADELYRHLDEIRRGGPP